MQHEFREPLFVKIQRGNTFAKCMPHVHPVQAYLSGTWVSMCIKIQRKDISHQPLWVKILRKSPENQSCIGNTVGKNLETLYLAWVQRTTVLVRLHLQSVVKANFDRGPGGKKREIVLFHPWPQTCWNLASSSLGSVPLEQTVHPVQAYLSGTCVSMCIKIQRKDISHQKHCGWRS